MHLLQKLRIPLFVLLFPILFHSSIPAQQQVIWKRDLNQAWSDAQTNQRPLLIYFRDANARPCQELEATTIFHPGVTSYLSAGFTCAVVEAPQNPEVARQLGVIRVPTIIIMNINGNEVSRIVTKIDPDQFVQALNGVEMLDVTQVAPPEKTVFGGREFFREGFDFLHGWKNDGSAQGAQLQLSLVKGLDNRAFKVNYRLQQGNWSYVQFSRELDQSQYFQLPSEYTFVIQVAGIGGFNSVDLKLIDTDYDSFGISMPIPNDGKPHQFAILSDDINFLWGEGNQQMDPIKIIQIAITPDKDRFVQDGIVAERPYGTIFLDEFVIVPGKRADIESDFRKTL